MRHKARNGGGKYALLLLLCPPIGLLFVKRLDMNFAISSDSKISRFTRPLVIGFVAVFFPHWGADLKISRFCRIRQMRVDGSRIRKEKVAVSKISGYVWSHC